MPEPKVLYEWTDTSGVKNRIVQTWVDGCPFQEWRNGSNWIDAEAGNDGVIYELLRLAEENKKLKARVGELEDELDDVKSRDDLHP